MTPPAATDPALREEIARVIDPFNWEERSSYYDRADKWFEQLGVEDHALVGGYRAKAEEIVAPSLAKADALIAAGIVRSPVVGEDVVERVARAINRTNWTRAEYADQRWDEDDLLREIASDQARAALAAMPDTPALLGRAADVIRHMLEGRTGARDAGRAILHEIEGTKL